MNIAYYILSDNHLPWVAFASVLSLNLIFPFPWGTISVFSETDGPCSKSLLGSSLFIQAHFSGEFKLGGFDLSIRNSMISFCITVILCCRTGSLQDSTWSQGWLTPLDFTIFLIISFSLSIDLSWTPQMGSLWLSSATQGGGKYVYGPSSSLT